MHAIIGAGIGGLTTALAFEKLNIDYQIFEKSENSNAVGAGIWLAPNALKVYEWLGILEQIQQSGNAINRITVTDKNLDHITDSAQSEAVQKFGFSTVAIHRVALQKVLLDNIPQHKIHWNKSLLKYEESNDNIHLFFKDGSTTKATHIIGADGINSEVRKQLFPESKIRYSGQTCWRGITSHNIDSEFNHRGIEMWGDKIRFGLSKVSANQTYWFAVAKSEAFQKDDMENLKKELLKKYKNYHSVVTSLIENTSIDNIIRNDIIDLKPLKKWYSNNVCLIGDAGHATTPNMGQGGAQAIEDAYFLANSIANGDNPFKKFQDKRFKKVNSIVQQSWYTGKIAHMGIGSGVRNFIFKSMPKSLIDKKMNEVYQLG